MIEVNRKDFAAALKVVAGVASNRATIPILSNVRATANGALALEATDLDTWLRAEVPYSGEQGTLMLPAPRTIMAAVNAAGGELVRLSPAENGTAVAAGALTMELPAQAVDDFPYQEWPAAEMFTATLGADVLAQLARIMPAISTEETRYYLNGIYLHHVADWEYRAVATDGHRLMMATIMLPDAAGVLPDPFIIPRAFLRHVLGLFAGRRTIEPVRLVVGKHVPANTRGQDLDLDKLAGMPRMAWHGQCGGAKVVAGGKLIDGGYPDYKRVIPTPQAPMWLEMGRGALLAGLQAVMPLMEGKFRAVSLSADAAGLRIVAQSPVVGKASTVVPASHNWPGDFQIGFNAGYLVSMLQAAGGEGVRLEVTDSSSPGLLTNPEDTTFTGVLMPMRV